MTTQNYDKPLPIIDELSKPFWDHALEHRLSVQACTHCRHLQFPPSPVCPKCLSDEQEWLVVSGQATLLSWVKFHRAYWDGFMQHIPYDACLVQLKEGPIMVSNFSGPTPANVHVGMPLKVTFEHVTPEVALSRFTPA